MLQITLWGGPVPVSEKEQEYVKDPRPDLSYDSREWTRFLNMANKENSFLGGTLHGFRCGGLRLHRGRQGWALRPELDPKTSIWETVEEYTIDRDQWLGPYKREIIELLKKV